MRRQLNFDEDDKLIVTDATYLYSVESDTSPKISSPDLQPT